MYRALSEGKIMNINEAYRMLSMAVDIFKRETLNGRLYDDHVIPDENKQAMVNYMEEALETIKDHIDINKRGI